MNNSDLFAGEKVYGTDWKEAGRRDFNSTEKSQVRFAKVTQGEYSLACCFYLSTGGQIYFPFTQLAQTKVKVGDVYSLDDLSVVFLERDGEIKKRVEPKNL